MTDSTTPAAPRNTEEQLVRQLHDAAVEYEGTRIQGLLCRAGDVVMHLSRCSQEWALRAARRISSEMHSSNRTHTITENPRDRYERIARIIVEEYEKPNAPGQARVLPSPASAGSAICEATTTARTDASDNLSKGKRHE